MESNLTKILMSMQRCSNASDKLYDELKSNFRLSSIGFFNKHEGGYTGNFYVMFNNPVGEFSKVHGISICYPSDAYQNQNRELNPSIIEIALIDSNHNLCYDSDLGYADICRFYSSSEIIEEIIRISSNNF
jgi:hypothetical protein